MNADEQGDKRWKFQSYLRVSLFVICVHLRI